MRFFASFVILIVIDATLIIAGSMTEEEREEALRVCGQKLLKMVATVCKHCYFDSKLLMRKRKYKPMIAFIFVPS